jgi:quercetin dioxygenase-like cupin family protein
MTVVGVAGTGLYQEWGKAPVLIRPGDVVNIPAGVSHFHGATKDSAFQQFVVYDSEWKAPDGFNAHTGKVSATEYAQANLTAANPKTTQKNDSEFLFGNGLKEFTSSNFNQPVFLGKVLTKPNAASSPEWIYVAFDAGTYNRWHSHKTGQVLIATDGMGYHQIKGEKPQVLRPGDVVFCPPGVIHWHGAAPDSKFAHIAINPDDNHEVNWYDFPEYVVFTIK